MITEAALKKLEQLKPELLAEFGMRRFARKRLAANEPSRASVLYVEYVEEWLLRRGVRVRFVLAGNVLVPICAVLVV